MKNRLIGMGTFISSVLIWILGLALPSVALFFTAPFMWLIIAVGLSRMTQEQTSWSDFGQVICTPICRNSNQLPRAVVVNP